MPMCHGSATGGDDAASADGSSATTGAGPWPDDDFFEGLGWLDTLADQGSAVSDWPALMLSLVIILSLNPLTCLW
jgi:hypothetical protein